MTAPEDTPLAVLLLDERLEQFALRAQAEDLLRALGVVAVDPPRLSYRALGRLPELAGDAVAVRQARRLTRSLRRRRGRPRVVVMFEAMQYPLARALVAEAGDPAELWYWRIAPPSPEDERAAALDALAAQRATLMPDLPPPTAGIGARAVRELDDPLWRALAQRGVDVRVTR